MWRQSIYLHKGDGPWDRCKQENLGETMFAMHVQYSLLTISSKLVCILGKNTDIVQLTKYNVLSSNKLLVITLTLAVASSVLSAHMTRMVFSAVHD